MAKYNASSERASESITNKRASESFITNKRTKQDRTERVKFLSTKKHSMMVIYKIEKIGNIFFSK